MADGQGDLVGSQQDLRKLLMDEGVHHITNFHILKAEHRRLQNEYSGSQSKLQHLLQEKRTIHHKCQALLGEFREELLTKSREVEELKTQVITPQKLELLKAQMQHDLEVPIRAHLQPLEEEMGKCRTEYKKVCCELNFLRSELERQKEEQARILEASKLKYESEVIVSQKLELLKAQIQHDLETMTRARFWKLDEEVEKVRTENKKLCYELNFLKSEFEHHREEHAHMLEESKLKYESEVASLEKDKEELHNHLHRIISTDNKQVEALLGEKAQLILKLNGLEAEVTEFRAQRENPGIQVENGQRIQGDELAEMQGVVRFLEEENQSIKLQLEHAEKELLLSNEQNALLNSKLHKAEQEISALTTAVEEIKNSTMLEIADIKLKAALAGSVNETERNALQIKADELLQSNNEILKTVLELLEEKNGKLVDKIETSKEGFRILKLFKKKS